MTPDEISERTASAIAAWLKAEAAKTRAAAQHYRGPDNEIMHTRAETLDQAALDVATGSWLPQSDAAVSP